MFAVNARSRRNGSDTDGIFRIRRNRYGSNTAHGPRSVSCRIKQRVIEVYVAIYAANNGLPGGGIYFIAIAGATVFTRVLLDRVVDIYGEEPLVLTGNLAGLISILLLVFCHNTACYILSAVAIGYSFGAIQPSLQTMALHAVTPERRGAANSTFFVAFDLGIALGCFLAGILIQYLGYDRMFLIIATMFIISTASYYMVGRNHASSLSSRLKIS